MNNVMIMIYHNIFGLYVSKVMTMVILLNIQYMSFTILLEAVKYSAELSLGLK